MIFADLTDKFLRPVVSEIPDPDLFEIGVQNIGTVTAGVHPGVHDGLGRFLPIRDVLPGSAISQSERADHLKRRSVRRAGVGKIMVVGHILRFVARYARQLPVRGERLKAFLRARLVDKTDDLVFVRKGRPRDLRDIENFARIDQIRVFNLRIGGDDLAHANLILHGQLPHGIAGDDRVGKAVGEGRRDHHGCKQNG